MEYQRIGVEMQDIVDRLKRTLDTIALLQVHL